MTNDGFVRDDFELCLFYSTINIPSLHFDYELPLVLRNKMIKQIYSYKKWYKYFYNSSTEQGTF